MEPGSPRTAELLADADAEYAAVIEIDLAEIKEPMSGLPERPGRRESSLSAVAGTKIDEVFIGSCMTNIGHFRAAGKISTARGHPGPPVDRAADQDGRFMS